MHLSLSEFIANYGYIAILLGSIAEGETITLLGGLAAHEGLLKYSMVVLVALTGAIIGDQLLYALGYRFGTRILHRFHRYQHKITRANRLIRRHPGLFVIGVRFMYGFRIVGPIIIGASRLSPWKFLVLNVIGAIIWAFIFVTLGFFAGEVIAPWLYKLHHHLKMLFWVVGIIAVVLLLKFLYSRQKNS